MGCGSSSGRSTPPAEPGQKRPEQPAAQPERDWLAEKPSAWIAEVAEDAEQQAELAPVRNQCAALGVVTFGDMQRLSAEEMRAMRSELKPVPREKARGALMGLAPSKHARTVRGGGGAGGCCLLA